MDLSFRRVAGRMVLAAGVCAAAILVVRGDEKVRADVTYVIDPRPLGAALRHLDVTIAVGDTVSGWQSGDWDRERPLEPLRLVTPTPSGEVTITLDVLTTTGAHRIVHHARPPAGSIVEIVIGAPGGSSAGAGAVDLDHGDGGRGAGTRAANRWSR